jgi:hypothetical protein
MLSLQLAEYRRCWPDDPAAAMLDPNCHVLAVDNSNNFDLCSVLSVGLILGIAFGVIFAEPLREQQAAALVIEQASAQPDEPAPTPRTSIPEEPPEEMVEDATNTIEQSAQPVSAPAPPLAEHTLQDHSLNTVNSQANKSQISDIDGNVNTVIEDISEIQSNSTPFWQLTDDTLEMLLPQVADGVPSISNVPSLGTATTHTTATTATVPLSAIDPNLDPIPADQTFVFDLGLQGATDMSPREIQEFETPSKDVESAWLINLKLFEGEGPMTDP